ncbi:MULTISPECIES: ankyrin repeat domain-containing protein [Myxococcus]|uniref:ankyrin repeat domain-containing protein n=1 Tax=Myxococcus TaxID=32 RepID=UPI00114262CA|nr:MULTISPECIES: ankyrin repeat domain-containing protein [Myxococcus]MCK8502240.1 ankyrin repeat domain-containing protein [Myxococcus fulvus]
MTQQQYEFLNLIRQVRSHNFIEDHIRPRDPADYERRLAKEQAENEVTLEEIRQALASGLSLDFADQNHHTPLLTAVTQNNVALIQLLMAHGADIRVAHGNEMPLHRAAEFGADRVVRFIIEQGVDPRTPSPFGGSALRIARNSRHSRGVPAMLVQLLLPTKDQRPPPPKKLKGLSEEKVMKYLSSEPPAGVSAASWTMLRGIMEAVFVEAHAVSLEELYAGIEDRSSVNPDLVFAAIGLIQAVIVEAPKNKSVKKLAKDSYAHHGDLEINGPLTVKSLLVTGNLTVKGKAANRQGASLFVGGAFTCESFYTEGPVIIGGDLDASHVEAAHNDYALEVRGTLRTPKLVVKQHVVKAGHFEVQERVDS